LNENKKGEFSETGLKEIRKLIIENKDVILAQLDLFYAEKPVKSNTKMSILLTIFQIEFC